MLAFLTREGQGVFIRRHDDRDEQEKEEDPKNPSA